MSDFPAHMLTCAKFYNAYDPPTHDAIPDTFDDVDGAIERLRDSLLFEAHRDMQTEIPAPPTPVLNAVDLPTSEPGIVHSRGARVSIDRSDANVIPVVYRREIPTSVDNSKVCNVTPARIRRLVETASKKTAKNIERNEAKAIESLEREERRNEPRTRKKKEKSEEPTEPKTTKEPNAGSDDDNPPRKRTRVTKNVEEPDDIDLIGLCAGDSLKPKPKRTEKLAFYASPVPHHRHLTALVACDPHPNVRDTLLRGVPSENEHLVIVQGPPGTGKSHALIESLAQYSATNPEHRSFICAPTNVGAADLYLKAFRRGLVGHLVLSKEKTPPEAPRIRALDESSAKLVFSTITGRSGPKLFDQKFDAVFIDEAAHCPESSIWGLLRAETTDVFMCGDTKQLPAQVSNDGMKLRHDRSIMERLDELGVSTTTLTTQRRMHPDIVAFPNAMFYDGALQTEYTPAEDLAHFKACDVVRVEGDEKCVGTSFENIAEARAVQEFIGELRAHNIDTARVIVVTPYAAQQRLLQSLRLGARIETVDAIQGKESDVILLSIVRTKNPGFWEDDRRLNVALTRARHVLRIFACESPLLKEGMLGRAIQSSTNAP